MESMDDFQAEIDQSFRKINEGDILTGTVIGMSDEAVMLDLKYYAPGLIRLEDYSDDPKFNIRRDVKVGEEISAVVIGTDDGNGNLLLSRKEAREGSAWDWFQEAMDQKQGLKVKIAEAVKAGVICYPNGIRAFIPASKLSLGFVDEKDLPAYVGKEMEVRVITCDKKDGKLVLSAKEILKEQADRERAEKVSNVKVGLVTEGSVESLQNYGAFVDLGEGLSGLVHISQISNTRISHPSAVLKVGQKIKVKVIKIQDGKISLSMKGIDEVSPEEVSEEKIKYESGGEATTSLADLIKKAGF